MINIKKTLLVIAAFVGFIGLHSSVLANVAAPDPTFELYNKSKKEIFVTLTIPQVRDPIEFIIPANDTNKRLLAIDTSFELAIAGLKGNHDNFSEEYSINAPGKTKYLTYDPSKSVRLYPQTGPLGGWKGETESGYSLSNNVTSNNIKKLLSN